MVSRVGNVSEQITKNSNNPWKEFVLLLFCVNSAISTLSTRENMWPIYFYSIHEIVLKGSPKASLKHLLHANLVKTTEIRYFESSTSISMLKQCPLTPNLVESDKQTLSRQVASLSLRQIHIHFQKRHTYKLSTCIFCHHVLVCFCFKWCGRTQNKQNLKHLLHVNLAKTKAIHNFESSTVSKQTH